MTASFYTIASRFYANHSDLGIINKWMKLVAPMLLAYFIHLLMMPRSE
jgi:hypothetical protein